MDIIDRLLVLIASALVPACIVYATMFLVLKTIPALDRVIINNMTWRLFLTFGLSLALVYLLGIDLLIMVRYTSAWAWLSSIFSALVIVAVVKYLEARW